MTANGLYMVMAYREMNRPDRRDTLRVSSMNKKLKILSLYGHSLNIFSLVLGDLWWTADCRGAITHADDMVYLKKRLYTTAKFKKNIFTYHISPIL